MLVIHAESGPLGTITLAGDTLTGSAPGVQALADDALATTGSAAAAYGALSRLGNGYLDAEEVPDEPLEFGWRFNPLEHRNAHGEWSRGAGDVLSKAAAASEYREPPADRQAMNKTRASANPFINKYGLSKENIVRAWDATTPDERDQGMRWYSDAHDVALAIGKGDADKGAAMLSAFSVQTDWATDVMNAASTFANGKVPDHGVGITGSVRARAQAILDARGHDEIEALFPAQSSSKTRNFYHLIRNGGDRPGDTEGHVVIDRHALSVAAGRRLTSQETVAPTLADIKEDHPDWSPAQVKAYHSSFPADPTGAPYTYQHIGDMYRSAAKQVSERDGIQVSPHQMQAATWMHQLNSNDADDSHLIELAAAAAAAGGKMSSVPGAATAKGRASAMKNRWAAWSAYAAAHQIPVHVGTTVMDGTISGQVAAYELASGSGWRDAWHHELRGSDGKWLKGPGSPFTHQEYGHGTVSAVDGRTATVRFDDGSTRQFGSAMQYEPVGDDRYFKAQIGPTGEDVKYPGDPAQHLSPEIPATDKGWQESGPWQASDRNMVPYTTRGNAKIEAALRRGEMPEPPMDAGAVDRVIAKRHLTQPTVLYRGIGLSPELKQRLVPGAEFSDQAYTSTTTAPEWADEFAHFRITGTAPWANKEMLGEPHPGWEPARMVIHAQPGQEIGPGEPGLAEYVLPRDSRYRVESVAPGADGTTEIHMSVQQSGAHTALKPVDYPDPRARFLQHHDVLQPDGSYTRVYGGSSETEAVELSWRDAWLHEMRDSHGRWTRDPGAVAAAVTRLAAPATGKSVTPSAAVRKFVQAADDGVPGMFGPHETLAWDGKPPSVYRDSAHPDWSAFVDFHGHMNISSSTAKGIRDGLAGTGPVADPDAFMVPLHELIHLVVPAGHERGMHDAMAYVTPGGQAIEEGFTELSATHHAAEFFGQLGIGDRGTPFVATDEAGHIKVSPEYGRKAGALADALESEATEIMNGKYPGINSADRFELPSAMRQLADAARYGTLTRAGAWQASDLLAVKSDPGYTRRAGELVGQVADLMATPDSGHHTMASWAAEMDKPERIKNGQSWGHYAPWTKKAQEWTEHIASQLGQTGPDAARKLSDQVSAVATADKTRIMAEQLLVAKGLHNLSREDTARILKSAQEQILASWGSSTAQAVAEATGNSMRAAYEALQAEAA